MRASQTAINMIKYFEGCVLHAYKCMPYEEYYTIGYGHYGSDVRPDMVITQDMAETMLKCDIVKYETLVNMYQSKYNFNQNEFDALVSFAYNIGSITQLTQDGTRTKAEIADAIPLYIHSGDMIIEGLVKRRNEERQLFITPVNVSRETYKESDTFKKLVDDIIAGKLGNDEERKEKIYDIVQSLVNDRLRG